MLALPKLGLRGWLVGGWMDGTDRTRNGMRDVKVVRMVVFATGDGEEDTVVCREERGVEAEYDS